MPVITVINPKGGTGKTTLSLVLALTYAARSLRVSLIDADINRPLKRWHGGDDKPVDVVSDLTDDTIVDAIDRERTRNHLVIIDNEGVGNVMSRYTIARADLVLIPMNVSTLDATEAWKAIRLVRNEEKVRGRSIPIRAVLTRTSEAIKRRRAPEIVEQLARVDVETLDARLYERGAFESLFRYRTTLEGLPPDVGGVDKAQRDAKALADEVQNVLRKIGEGRAAA